MKLVSGPINAQISGVVHHDLQGLDKCHNFSLFYRQTQKPLHTIFLGTVQYPYIGLHALSAGVFMASRHNPETKERLDDHDRELLLILANNPDWTYEQIAEHMGMTSRSVGYRIERLRNMRVIQKAHLIYYDRLGDMIYAVILRFRTGVSGEEQEKIIWQFKEDPSIIQVFSAVGSFGLIVLFHAEDPKEADRLIRDLVISKGCFENYQVSQITDIYSIYRHYI